MSSKKMSIAFYVEGMGFEGDSLNKHSLGGSETAGLCMAREMAGRGHEVSMYCNTEKPGKYDGVKYYNVKDFPAHMKFNGVDVCVVQRIPQAFGDHAFRSKLNILWQHDLGLKRNRQHFLGSLWNIDKVFGLSDFHIKQMSEVYKTPENVYWKTRNGIDPVRDYRVKRYPKRLIYTARPERGMDILLNDIMPKIWEKDSEVELMLAGYDNVTEQMKPFYDSLAAKIAEHQKNGFKVKHLGPLSKEQLYKEYQKATLYVYPTDFEETSCITMMECMANGLPVMASELAALPETLKKAVDARWAVTFKGSAREEEYHKEFVEATLEYLDNFEERNTKASEELKTLAPELSWTSIAEEWEAQFYELFKEKTENKETLAKHFYRNEDIMALLKLNDPKWNERVRNEYPILSTKKDYHALYEDYGKQFKEDINSGKVKVSVQPYTRVKVALEIMREKPPKKILDFGCAIGNEAIQFVNEFGCTVDSINISKDEMEVGQQLAQQHCKSPEKINWIQGDTPDIVEGEYDYIFAGEILEHVADPTDLINKLEAKCVKGGKMIFTVPFGPWGDFDIEFQQRGHLWSFDSMDLQDLFGEKKKMKLRSIPGEVNSNNNELLGWFVVEYVKSGAPTGRVDMERKVLMQSPRQTVSACMIIGGKQEGLLHRCLQSIYPFVDEIVVLDTGMSKTSADIVNDPMYKGKMKLHGGGPNPLEVGFDEARNASIKYAKGDWILWIDSDEELLDGVNIYKFLRNNAYEGYAIRQHHFSAQPPDAFKADMPVRFFRNDEKVKFYGVVHEHPEKAMNEGIGFSTIVSDVNIAHDGYLVESVRRARFNRNFDLICKDRDKYPERELGKFLMMRDWLHCARYTLEQTRGQLTKEVFQWCEQVIEAYQSEFMEKESVGRLDGLMFYSEALKILNRGVECSFFLNVGGNNLLSDRPVTARFETKDDLAKFLASQTTVGFEPFEGRYV